MHAKWCSNGSLQFKWLPRELWSFGFITFKTILGVGSWKSPGINPTFAFCYVTGLAPSKYGSAHLFTLLPLVKKNGHNETFLFICQHQSKKITYVLEYPTELRNIRFRLNGSFPRVSLGWGNKYSTSKLNLWSPSNHNVWPDNLSYFEGVCKFLVELITWNRWLTKVVRKRDGLSKNAVNILFVFIIKTSILFLYHALPG